MLHQKVLKFHCFDIFDVAGNYLFLNNASKILGSIKFRNFSDLPSVGIYDQKCTSHPPDNNQPIDIHLKFITQTYEIIILFNQLLIHQIRMPISFIRMNNYMKLLIPKTFIIRNQDQVLHIFITLPTIVWSMNMFTKKQM